jgi:hypothetical protein
MAKQVSKNAKAKEFTMKMVTFFAQKLFFCAKMMQNTINSMLKNNENEKWGICVFVDAIKNNGFLHTARHGYCKKQRKLAFLIDFAWLFIR